MSHTLLKRDRLMNRLNRMTMNRMTMNYMTLPFLLLCIISSFAKAALIPDSIPRAPTDTFVEDGLYEGGSGKRANLESLRLAEHNDDGGYERWVIDFSDPATGKVGTIAPKFQIRYLKQERNVYSEGKTYVKKPAKFLFFFRNIAKNYLDQELVSKLAMKSQFVKKIILYPPIEQGDMAMEFILNDNIAFETHQPIQKEGRLVLDIKAIGTDTSSPASSIPSVSTGTP